MQIQSLSINTAISWIKDHKYVLIILIIVAISSFLRLYNFNNHWGIGNDDARDALIAREALKRKELPIMGSFSSAGPFAFGPLFYWTVMLSYILMPFTFLAPWILTALVGIITVGVLIYCGHRIGGPILASILGLLAATSPQLVVRSLSLGQHTYIAFTSSLLLLSFILLWQTKKTRYAFCMGLSLGIALSMHFQALNLIVLCAPILVIPQTTIKKKLLFMATLALGGILPTLPYLYWESGQQFANTRNLLDYLLIGQNRIYVPNSWKLFLFNYFPQYWSFVSGHYKIIAGITIITSALAIITAAYRKKLPGSMYAIIGVFATLTLIIRYYKGERSEGYLLYFLPLILLVSAYTIFLLKKWGILLLALILFGNLNYYVSQYMNYSSAVPILNRDIQILVQKYPDTKFSVYDYKWQHSYHSQPLSFLLEKQGKIDKNGMKIGFVCNKECNVSYPAIQKVNGLDLFDLSNETDLTPESGWVNVNQASMYDDLMKWSKTEKLQSNFVLFKQQ